MSDDWDETPPANASSFADEGKSGGRGRGSRSSSNYGGNSGSYRGGGGNRRQDTPKNDDDNWDNVPSSGNNDDGNNGGDSYGGGNDYNSDDRGERRGGRGGRGRGGRGGGRGGRGGGRGGYNRDGDRDDNENGGYKKRRNDDGQEDGMDDMKPEGDEEQKKPPVTYIPPERSENEDDLYKDGISVGINFSKYDKIEVQVTGENPPPRADSFADMKLRVILNENIVKSNYTEPTPVQKHAVPIINAGRDMMACAQTGSGKTASYMLPIVQALLENPKERILTGNGCEPQVVIMVPTRELVVQICQVADMFARGTSVKCMSVYGGVQTSYQRKRLQSGIDIIVATPGRLKDFVSKDTIGFGSVRFMVLDEADRMLDQGFLGAMKEVLEHSSMVPVGQRQTMMFSATLNESVQSLARTYMKPDYLFVAVGIVGGACDDIEQVFHEVGFKEKRGKLFELLSADHSTTDGTNKTLVFVEKQRTADFIASFLSEKEFPTTSIHGAREQREREQALSDFRSGKMPILVATSVAARGLDIKGVTHVINYDLPKEIDDYVHRIGRTGRLGNKGKATSFYDPQNDDNIRPSLVNLLRQVKLPIPECLDDNIGGGGGGGAADEFGGYDIRGNTDNAAEGEAEPEEAW